MPKPSMKNALGASVKGETEARLQKADVHIEKWSASETGSSEKTAEASLPTQVVPVAKVLREAFTIPESEHSQIEAIRSGMLSQAVAVTKSEVLRAGLLLLFEADVQTQQEAFDRLERVRTGRPKTV